MTAATARAKSGRLHFLRPDAPAAGRVASLDRSSLVRRLVWLAAAWSLAVLVAAGIAMAMFFDHATISRLDRELSDDAEGLVAGVSAERGALVAPLSADPRSARAYSGEYWEVAVDDGAGGLHALLRSRSLWDTALTLRPTEIAALARTPGVTGFYDSRGPNHKPLRIAALQSRLPEIAKPVIFLAALDRSPMDREIRTFDATIATALLLLGAGLISAVVIQVRVGLRPLFALRREVAALRTGHAERVTGHYPTELEPLAVELNALMAHNHEVVERQRTHVGNLAHALKTPLSVVLTEAARQQGALSEVVTRQAETMRLQIDHHLRRARAAARAQGQGERTAVAPVVEELSRTLERIFRDKVSEIDWQCPDALCFSGERQDLLEIVGNVMENACKWCAGHVRVSAREAAGRRFAIIVEDDGPGLAEDQRGEVLRRGARLDESAPGSGLGLSIVDELVRAYRGAMTLGTSPLGGLSVEILLPRAD